jgi:hypothetical protein
MSTWIYLSDELILDYLTNEKSKYAISHYIKRILILNYQEEVEYKQVDKDNHLVAKYITERITDKKSGNGKKYYIVTETIYESLKNRRKYIKQYKNLEKIISDRISKELNGKREVCIDDNKRIDILTDTEIIEVKRYSNQLSAVGQIIYYSLSYPERKKRIHLFDHKNEKNIKFETMCKNLDISVTYE